MQTTPNTHWTAQALVINGVSYKMEGHSWVEVKPQPKKEVKDEKRP
jgi:hypothetical protein